MQARASIGPWRRLAPWNASLSGPPDVVSAAASGTLVDVTRLLSPLLRRLAAIAAAGLMLSACGPRAFQTLTDSAEPLRSTFNRDVGHTRVMMLVAPT